MKNMRFLVLAPSGEARVTLFRRPDSPRYWARFTWGKQEHRVSTGCHDPASARKFAEQVARETMGAAPAALTRTLSEVCQNMLADLQRTHSQRHVGTLSAITRPFLALHGQERAGSLTFAKARQLIGAYLAGMRYSALTIRNHRVGLSRLFSWAIKRGVVDWPANPAAGTLHSLPPIPHRVPVMPADADVDRLLEAAAHTEWYLALVLMLSGCRSASIGRATWADLQAGRITVTEKGRQRTIVLSPWAARELEARRRADPELLSPMHPDTVRHRLAAIREALRLPATLTLGGLRRYTDQRLYAAGVSPQHAAQVLGHAPSTSERHYLDWRALSSDTAAAALDRAPSACGKRAGIVRQISGANPAATARAL